MTKLQKFVGYVPTPYAFSGDWLTLLPFLWFKGSKGARVNYERYWIKVPEAIAPDGNDGPLRGWSKPHRTKDEKEEAVALDIAFPPSGTDPTKPMLLILHGLNGGSTEPYVLDLVRRANAANMTAVVLIARGLSKTPLQGEELFTGARTSDVGAAVCALHTIFGDEAMVLNKLEYKTKIVLVGFSMGAIIGANYTAKARESCGIVGNLSFSGTLCGQAMLDSSLPSNVHSHRVWQPALAWGLKATVIKPFLHLVCMGAIIGANYTAKARESCGIVGNLSFSGTLCGQAMLDSTLPSNAHSHRVWQPALAWGLKATVIKPFLHLVLKRGITTKGVEAIGSVNELDSKLVCAYHKYPNCGAYYEDLSAAGKGDAKGLARLQGAAVPLLEVHAMDDPIAVFEVAAVELVEQTENVMVLATKHGGHIGWPFGWRPTKNRWGYMMDISMEFTEAVCGVEGAK
eukprot:CAMPEP_0171324138 /NCGR_PEP_ID=MMETSP0816-20121228/115998_1 /TAXON_ID=420281 /ORGANISM="Proboscia inermis, Strain CCAP1064/1" /LENGTH=456 /DNA_ID=CAMNT_0011822993 /DNA_START=356 /DNA_END=1726 /DNA_ORIENTATION=-